MVLLVVPAGLGVRHAVQPEAMVHVDAEATVSAGLDELVIVFLCDIVVTGVEINTSEGHVPEQLVALELDDPLVGGAVLAELVVDDSVWELDGGQHLLLANEVALHLREVEIQRHGIARPKTSQSEGVVDHIEPIIDRFVRRDAVRFVAGRVLGVVMQSQFVEFTHHLR